VDRDHLIASLFYKLSQDLVGGFPGLSERVEPRPKPVVLFSEPGNDETVRSSSPAEGIDVRFQAPLFFRNDLSDDGLVRFPGLLEREDPRLVTLAGSAHVGLHLARHIHVAAAIALHSFRDAVQLFGFEVGGRLGEAQGRE